MRTASTFTPWIFVHNGTQGCFEIKVDTAPGKFSALIASTYSDNELAEKDARLIAAAPKLRQALEMITWSNDSKWQADCAAEALALVTGSGPQGVEDTEEDSACPLCGEDGGTTCGMPCCQY